MIEIAMSADELIGALLSISAETDVCILDSCGVGYLGSHMLIAGINPVSVTEIFCDDARHALGVFDDLTGGEAAIFTIAYDLGRKLLGIHDDTAGCEAEPDIFIATFASLVIHDYQTGKTCITGKDAGLEKLRYQLYHAGRFVCSEKRSTVRFRSNFTRDEYLDRVDEIKEEIRSGNTYQTNLTQQLTAELPPQLTPAEIFYRVRRDHPAAFAAFLQRPSSTVISASPERFIQIDLDSRDISTSPVKGTRPRGGTPAEDAALRVELLNSEKDRAENVMIVDLLRNDIGRVSEYGSVRVDRLCDIEEHPTFFHLVSTVRGTLRNEVSFGDVIKAVFPCGSITGAPKISTMKIIDRLEATPRGLSMGAIGYFVPGDPFGLPRQIDMSVAIRTMVIRDGHAVFNVGGGITIDSDPQLEYEESLIKAQALLSAIDGYLE